MTTWGLYCALHLGAITVIGLACQQADCTEPSTAWVHWPSGPVRCCARHTARWREVANAMGLHLVVEELPAWVPPERDEAEQRFALMEMT